ncbi:MAG: carboxypeptidase regulatory-like domain-containing protein, partial [Acidobacteria bacterium]|nr:carboxypeptidase regulatory-like domain-containing protein [Acidobacteriota bacterium]
PSRDAAVWRPFRVEAGGRAVKLTFSVTPLQVVRVRVVDGEGHPVGRARVECAMATGGGGEIGMTDAEGRYACEGLLPGAYRLRARPVVAGSRLAEREKVLSPIKARPKEGESWVATYYPRAVSWGEAETVMVGEGGVREFEIRLRSVAMFRARGVVVDEAGKGLSGAEVWLLSEVGWGTAEARVVAGADGSFEFPAVRAGAWKVSAEGKRGEVTLRGEAALEMPARDLEGWRLEVAPPFAVEGAVEGLPEGERASLSLAPVGGGESIGGGYEKVLRFEGLYAGRYRVAHWGVMERFYLRSVRLGGEEVTGRVVELTGQGARMQFVFRPGAARVEGRVEQGAGMKVVLVAADAEEYVEGQDVRLAVCDGEGRFTMPGVRPGEYLAFAFAMGGVNSDAMREAVFRLGLSREGRVVRLKEGESAVVDLKVTAYPAQLKRP